MSLTTTELIVSLIDLPRQHSGTRLDRAGVLRKKRYAIRRNCTQFAISLIVAGHGWDRGEHVTAPIAIIHRCGFPIACTPDHEWDECYIVFSGSEESILASAGIAELPPRFPLIGSLANQQFELLHGLLPHVGNPGVVDLLDNLAIGWLAWISAGARIPVMPTQAVAESYLRSHLCEPLELQSLATRCRCSTATLRRHWHTRHGLSPLSWLFRERMRLATQLLAETALSVASVALRCGYSNSRQFGTAFRRFSGSTASEWRLIARQSGSSARSTQPSAATIR